ncbi:hypothetical protein Bwad005_33430 [Bilophila wadsworthia]
MRAVQKANTTPNPRACGSGELAASDPERITTRYTAEAMGRKLKKGAAASECQHGKRAGPAPHGNGTHIPLSHDTA